MTRMHLSLAMVMFATPVEANQITGPAKAVDSAVIEINGQRIVDQGPAICEAIGEPDVYGRILARCEINNESLNEQLVRRGYAVARPSETTDYVAAEAEAKERKLGLWQGQFVKPSELRRSAGIFVDRP